MVEKKKIEKKKITKKKSVSKKEASPKEIEALQEKAVSEEPLPEKKAKEQIEKPVPAPVKEKIRSGEVVYQGTGRRKTAVAQVKLTPGEGIILVNRKSLTEYVCGRKKLEIAAMHPLVLTDTLKSYNVIASIYGGGIPSQAEALRHGIARALLEINPDWRRLLKKAGLLTRDPRMKERKKYGHKRARKSFQYSKR